MTRMTRREYLEARPQRQRRRTAAELIDLIKRSMKRKAIAVGLIEDPQKKPPKFRWEWMRHSDPRPAKCPAGVVEANTKGEAIALIKEVLGVSKNRPLPRPTSINRMPNAPSSVSACPSA